MDLKISGLFTTNVFPKTTNLIWTNSGMKKLMSEDIKNKIKLTLSSVHNSFVEKEHQRLDKIKEELEEQKQVKNLLI